MTTGGRAHGVLLMVMAARLQRPMSSKIAGDDDYDGLIAAVMITAVPVAVLVGYGRPRRVF